MKFFPVKYFFRGVGFSLKILLVGYYGYENFGDDLMLKSVQDFLDKVQFEYVIAMPHKVSENTISRFNPFEVIPAIVKSDAVVVGGGGILQDITSTRSFLYYYSFLEAALLFNKPIILFANSIGPVKKKFNRFLLRALLNHKNVFVFGRDPVTVRYVNYVGGDAELVCDPSPRILKKLEVRECYKKYDLLIVPRKKIKDVEFLKGFKNIAVCPAQPNDELTCKMIAKSLNAEYVEHKKMLEAILCSRLVLTERFHPAVVASYFGIPFVLLNLGKGERFFSKYTKDKKYFAKDIYQFLENYSKVLEDPLKLREILDLETDESFKQLYGVLLKYKKEF